MECPHSSYTTWTSFEILDLDLKFLNEELERLTNQKRVVNEEMNLTKRKIQYLKETGQETFDEIEFKSFAIIQAVRHEKMGDLELAKAVAEIVKG